MWEWKDSNGIVREFKPNSDTKRCPICGQYFKKGEKGCVIVPPMEVRTQHKKLQQNMIVHLSEWEAFCEGITTEEELVQKFIKHRTPKKQEFTENEKERISAFRSACVAYRFYEEFEKPYGLKCKLRGSSICVEYNVYSDTIDIDYRGRKGMFDGFYTRQIVTNIYNKMHEILGDGKKDDYNVDKTINSVFEEAKKIAGEFI